VADPLEAPRAPVGEPSGDEAAARPRPPLRAAVGGEGAPADADEAPGADQRQDDQDDRAAAVHEITRLSSD
jgi:hypothetical protein